MPISRRPAETPEERLERHRAAQDRYNHSPKGRARRERAKERIAEAKAAATPVAPTSQATGLVRLAEMVR
jgi:hypothetical protein